MYIPCVSIYLRPKIPHTDTYPTTHMQAHIYVSNVILFYLYDENKYN